MASPERLPRRLAELEHQPVVTADRGGIGISDSGGNMPGGTQTVGGRRTTGRPVAGRGSQDGVGDWCLCASPAAFYGADCCNRRPTLLLPTPVVTRSPARTFVHVDRRLEARSTARQAGCSAHRGGETHMMLVGCRPTSHAVCHRGKSVAKAASSAVAASGGGRDGSRAHAGDTSAAASCSCSGSPGCNLLRCGAKAKAKRPLPAPNILSWL